MLDAAKQKDKNVNRISKLDQILSILPAKNTGRKIKKFLIQCSTRISFI